MESSKTSSIKIQPFLMFQRSTCHAALKFYMSIFPNDSQIDSVDFYGGNDPSGAPEGSVRLARATIAGLELLAIDSPIEHGFDFTPSISLYVVFRNDTREEATGDAISSNASSQNRIEDAVEKLQQEGKVLMPLGDYGFPGMKKFAWVQDMFGVSWQLSLE